MLATALALLSALGPSTKWDLRGTSVVLVEGIRGGICGPTRHRTLALGYDWNRGAFRAVEEQRPPFSPPSTSVFRARDLGGDEFRKLVDQLLELGLPDLPLEQPAGCDDLYGRGTGIHFSHAARVWENQAPGGCTYAESSTRVTPQQIATFDAAVALLNRTLGGGPLEAASPLDALPLRDWSDVEVRLLARAVDVLRKRRLTGRANANKAALVGGVNPGLNLRIPCRNAQPFPGARGGWVSPVGWWDLRFDASGKRVLEVLETPIPGESAADTERRAAFVAAHPDLPVAQRDLILAGWIGDGMSEAMVQAALGDPVERAQRGSTIDLQYVRGCADGQESRVGLRLEADCLKLYW